MVHEVLAGTAVDNFIVKKQCSGKALCFPRLLKGRKLILGRQRIRALESRKESATTQLLGALFANLDCVHVTIKYPHRTTGRLAEVSIEVRSRKFLSFLYYLDDRTASTHAETRISCNGRQSVWMELAELQLATADKIMIFHKRVLNL